MFFSLSLPLLVSKTAASFCASFLLPLPLLVSKIAPPFSVSSLLPLPLLVRAVSSYFSSSLPLPLPLSLACLPLLSRFLCLSLSLYSKLEDIIDKISRIAELHGAQPIRKISFSSELTSLNFSVVYARRNAGGPLFSRQKLCTHRLCTHQGECSPE